MVVTELSEDSDMTGKFGKKRGNNICTLYYALAHTNTLNTSLLLPLFIIISIMNYQSCVISCYFHEWVVYEYIVHIEAVNINDYYLLMLLEF